MRFCNESHSPALSSVGNVVDIKFYKDSMTGGNFNLSYVQLGGKPDVSSQKLIAKCRKIDQTRYIFKKYIHRSERKRLIWVTWEIKHILYSKFVLSGNTTITNYRQTHDTSRKSNTTTTRHYEDKLTKAISSSLPNKLIAQPELTQSNAQ